MQITDGRCMACQVTCNIRFPCFFNGEHCGQMKLSCETVNKVSSLQTAALLDGQTFNCNWQKQFHPSLAIDRRQETFNLLGALNSFSAVLFILSLFFSTYHRMGAILAVIM